MHHVIRRLTAGLVAAAGSLAAAAVFASPASAGVIVHDRSGEPASGTITDQATADFPPGPYVADYPPGPYVGRSAIIPCL